MSDTNETFRPNAAHGLNRRGRSALKERGLAWVSETAPTHYTYLFEWMGARSSSSPGPHGHAGAYLEGQARSGHRDRGGPRRQPGVLRLHAGVVGRHRAGAGIDVDIRAHNREALEAHPMFRRIDLLEGSSTDSGLVDRVRAMAEGKSVLVCLDSSHTHDHVLRELEMYRPWWARADTWWCSTP